MKNRIRTLDLIVLSDAIFDAQTESAPSERKGVQGSIWCNSPKRNPAHITTNLTGSAKSPMFSVPLSKLALSRNSAFRLTLPPRDDAMAPQVAKLKPTHK